LVVYGGMGDGSDAVSDWPLLNALWTPPAGWRGVLATCGYSGPLVWRI